MLSDKEGAMDQDPWLTVEQISERLQFHPDTVRRLLREGKIRGHRVNRRAGWRVKASEIERFVEGSPWGMTEDVNGLEGKVAA